MEETNEHNVELLPHESVKLIKNTKGFNFEVKIIGEVKNNYKLTEFELNRLDDITKRLMEKYGEEK